MNVNAPTFGHLDLKIEQITAQMGVSRQALTLSESEDFFTDQILYRLVRRVMTVPGEQRIRVPLTWVDALKESESRRSPIMRWWVRQRPIAYRTWDAFEVLPNFPEVDRYRDTVRIARLIEQPRYDEDFDA